ncbi:hypothetical protein [Selenomonas ruminantium]|uniref:hypothetical protein n=1 Tax=Selenomonas ruminantium TaxID=971 RepID=UPI000407AD76|nr:hypothetical protein [Selenomonas ruminantium]
MGKLWRILMMVTMVIVFCAGSVLAAGVGRSYINALNSLPRVGTYVADMPGYTTMLQRKGYVFEEFHGRIGVAVYQESVDAYGRIERLCISPRQAVQMDTGEVAEILHKLSVHYGRPDESSADKVIWNGSTGYKGSFDMKNGILVMTIK